MNKEQLSRYIKYCEKYCFDETEAPYEWKLFGTLTFQRFLRFSEGRRLFYDWLGEIKKRAPPRSLYWFAVFYHCCSENRPRIHILLCAPDISFQRRRMLRCQDLNGGESPIADY